MDAVCLQVDGPERTDAPCTSPALEGAAAIVRLAAQPMLLLDASLRVVAAGEAFAQIFGPPPLELSHLQPMLSEALSRSEPQVMDLSTPGQPPRMIRGALKPLASPASQENVGYLLILDAAEPALAAARAECRHLHDIIEALPLPLYTTDAQGRLTLFNQAAARMAGRAPQLGTDRWCVSWKIYRPDGTPLPHGQCPMAVAIKENRPLVGEEAIAEQPDGTRCIGLTFPTPLRDAAGRLTGAVNIVVDITERRKTEEALRVARANAQLAQRAKTRFIATLSHELRTPLNAIAGWLHVLRPDQDGNVDQEDLREGLEAIDRNLRVETQLVNNLLNLTAGDGPVETLTQRDHTHPRHIAEQDEDRAVPVA